MSSRDEISARATELARRAKAGDERAVADLLEISRSVVIWAAQKTSRGVLETDPDRCWSEANLALVEALRVYDPERPWLPLYATVIHRRLITLAGLACRERCPRGRLLCSLDEEEGEGLTVAAMVPDPVDHQGLAEDREEIEVALQVIRSKLSKREWAAWSAVHVERLTYDEVCAKLNREYKQIDNAVRRASLKIIELRRKGKLGRRPTVTA